MEVYDFALAGEAKRDFLVEIENDKNKVVAEKFNGFREMWYLRDEGNEMLTRSGSSHIHAVPQFHQIIEMLDKTVIDCEGMSPQGNSSKYAKSIFGSGADHAIEVQRQYGNAYLVAFDILSYCGKDVRDLPFAERRDYLIDAIASLYNHGIEDIISEKLVHENKAAYYDEIVGRGGEGVIVKDLRAPYIAGSRDSWIKVKKVVTRDYYIVGFTSGNGKYADAIGAILYGIKNDTGGFDILGRSSGMTDVVRWDMARNKDRYIGKLAEFGGKDINENTGVLIHPTFIRIREDI